MEVDIKYSHFWVVLMKLSLLIAIIIIIIIITIVNKQCMIQLIKLIMY